MPISPQKAHERAIKGAIGRNSPDSYIRSLERTELTAEQKRRLTVLVMSFFAEPVGGAETGDAA
ncbi:MAG: hypothetical protein ACTHPS_30365 [Streptosporangiaceae bacterium]